MKPKKKIRSDIKQVSYLQVPVKAYLPDKVTLIGTGYVYYGPDLNQSIQLFPLEGRVEPVIPGFYHLDPDYTQERLVVMPVEVQ